MPQTFKHKNGTTIAGHADRWSNNERRPGSHEAGQGKKAARNQGTGEKGKESTLASTGIDTANMNKEDKLKYFQSLGLMPGEEKLTIKNWPEKLRELFDGETVYIKDIADALKSTPKQKYKDAIEAGLNATKEVLHKALDVYDSYEFILNAIVKAGEILESTQSTENIQSTESTELEEDRTPLQQLQDVLSTITTPDYVDAILKILNRIHSSKKEQATLSTLQVANDARKLPRDEAIQQILQNIKLFK